MYELLWFFILYSLAGWTLGTAAAAVREKKFVDIGFLFGPYCPSYGISALLFAVFLSELKNNLFFLFLGGTVLSFFVTIGTGFVLERIFHRKWWDYSRKRFQFGGYVTLPYTVLWGLIAVFCVSFANPLLTDLMHLIPRSIGELILIIAGIILGIDLIGTISGILTVRSRVNKASIVYRISEDLQNAAEV